MLSHKYINLLKQNSFHYTYKKNSEILIIYCMNTYQQLIHIFVFPAKFFNLGFSLLFVYYVPIQLTSINTF